MSKFGTKSTLFEYFLARILKNYSNIWDQHFQITVIEIFCQETKMPKFGTKNPLLGIGDPLLGTNNPLFGYFGLTVLKNDFCHIWNEHPRICPIEKFPKKTKKPEFQTKNALFGYFSARLLENYCHIWNQHLQPCLIGKVCGEKK